MSVILSRKQIKELENLFSWSQFYENSESLAVARYPRHYTWVDGKKTALTPDSDIKNHAKTQEQIRNIGNK